MNEPPLLICPRCLQRGSYRRCPRDGAFLVSESALRQAPRDSRLGTLVANRYAIIQCLGVGGMGAVYRARDEVNGKPLAIKFLREEYSNNESIRTRFELEAAASLAVDSPHVVRLLNFGVEADKTMWLAMEFVQGWTLRDEVNHNGVFTVAQSIELCRQILLGLIAAHAAHLVHRDLKHDNIMFSGTRDHFVARILDFGIVKANTEEDPLDSRESDPRPMLPVSQTGEQMMIGSPSYMSPEQIRGIEVHAPADLYSLGVIIYETLTARRLFTVNDQEELKRPDAQREVPPLFCTAGGEPIPESYNRFLQKALELDPADRFPDANTMLLALQQLDLSPDRLPEDLFADPPVQSIPLEEEGLQASHSVIAPLPISLSLQLSQQEQLLSEPSLVCIPSNMDNKRKPKVLLIAQQRKQPARWMPPCLAIASALLAFLMVTIFL